MKIFQLFFQKNQAARSRNCDISLSLLCTALAVLLLFSQPQPAAGSADENSAVFRLHILANSDSAADQQTKLRVRNAVLAYEAQRFPQVDSAAQTREALLADGAGLSGVVEQALDSCGAAYGAQLKVGVYDFPDRTYANATYPAGKYAALRIVLGEGNGQNWWCVMFPPLCITEEAAGEAKENNGQTGIQWKSWIAELLKGKA